MQILTSTLAFNIVLSILSSCMYSPYTWPWGCLCGGYSTPRSSCYTSRKERAYPLYKRLHVPGLV